MCDIRKAVDMAIAVEKFSNEIKTTRITMTDIKDIAYFKPDILDDITKISDWIEGKDLPTNNTDSSNVNAILDTIFVGESLDDIFGDNNDNHTKEEIEIPDPVPIAEIFENEVSNEEEAPAVDETEVVEKDEIPHEKKKMNQNDYKYLASLIADNYNGKDYKEARKELSEKFPMWNFQSIYRFCGKITFPKISDEYFDLKDDVIISKPDRPECFENKIDVILSNLKERDKFYDVINKEGIEESEWKKMVVDIIDASSSMEKILEKYPDISGNDLVKYEIVKKAMCFGGLISSNLYEIDMAIIIASCVKIAGKKKVSKISSAVRKKWNVGNLRSEQVFGIVNKTTYPEICNKFFA